MLEFGEAPIASAGGSHTARNSKGRKRIAATLSY
jgi:hypothetical protein